MSVVDTVKAAVPSISLPTVTIPSVEIPAAVEKPVFAVVGAGDLAVEKAKSELTGLPAHLQARLTELSGKATATATKAQAQVEAQAKAFPVLVKALPALVKATFAEKVTKPASARQGKAEALYGTLATRGEKVLGKAPVAAPVAKPAAKKASTKKASA